MDDELHETDLRKGPDDRDVTDLSDENLGRAARLIADNDEGALIFNFNGRRYLRRIDG